MSQNRNRILDYLSAVHGTIESELIQVDQYLADEDDGENHTVQEGKEQAVSAIDDAIARLNALRKDIDNLPHGKFCKKHNIDE